VPRIIPYRKPEHRELSSFSCPACAWRLAKQDEPDPAVRPAVSGFLPISEGFEEIF
jgi:hypothetical protein